MHIRGHWHDCGILRLAIRPDAQDDTPTSRFSRRRHLAKRRFAHRSLVRRHDGRGLSECADPAPDLQRQVPAYCKRAAAILSSPAVWNQADDRRCTPNATTFSIYCAAVQATDDVTGGTGEGHGIDHRRPALEFIRVVVAGRSKGRHYHTVSWTITTIRQRPSPTFKACSARHQR